jgi:hypothetical protein
LRRSRNNSIAIRCQLQRSLYGTVAMPNWRWAADQSHVLDIAMLPTKPAARTKTKFATAAKTTAQ